MQAIVLPSTPSVTSSKRRWAGIALTALPVAFLTLDALMKVVKIAPVVEASARIGYGESTLRPIGLVLLASLALYLVRRTSVLGAVLVTAYLGGAVATHVRLGDPIFTHTLSPVYFAVFLWLGLYLRDTRLRAIVPWR